MVEALASLFLNGLLMADCETAMKHEFTCWQDGWVDSQIVTSCFNDQLARMAGVDPDLSHSTNSEGLNRDWNDWTSYTFKYLNNLTSSDILRLHSRRLQQCLILLDGEIRQVCPDFVWIRNAVDPSEIICLRLSHWANHPTSQLLHSNEPHLDRCLPKRFTILFDFSPISMADTSKKLHGISVRLDPNRPKVFLHHSMRPVHPALPWGQPRP